MWRVTESGNILRNYAIKTSYEHFKDRKTAAALCSDLLSSFEECHIITMLFREGLGDCLRDAPYATAYDLSLAKGRVRVFAKSLGLSEETVENIVSLIGIFSDVSASSGQASIIEVLEMQKERARGYATQREQRVVIEQESDFDRIICANVEDLSISSSYKGRKVPSLKPFIMLKKFSSVYPISLSKVAEIDMQNVRELCFTNADANSDIQIAAPVLERLSINNKDNCFEELTPIEKMLSRDCPRLNIQAPSLKRIELNHFGGYDLSAIAKIDCLETLILRHLEATDLSWLKNCKGLKKLYIVDSTVHDIADIPRIETLQELYLDYSGIESLRGISLFPNLRLLNLRGNKISTIADSEKLNHIRRIDLSRNPVADTRQIGVLQTPQLILTDMDRERYKFDDKMDNVFWQAYHAYLHREKNIDSLHPYLKDSWLKQNEVERYANLVNLYFEDSFYSLNPTAATFEYDTKLKRQYLEFVKEQYPFITIKDDFEKQIQREYFGISHFYKEEPGNVIYANQSVYTIKITMLNGEKGVDVEFENTGSQRHQSLCNAAIKKAIAESFPYIDLTRTKVRVVVFDLYRTGNIDGIETGILTALHSLIQGMSIPVTTFIAGEYKQKGLFKRLKVSSKTMLLAKTHNAERVVFFTGGKQEQVGNSGIQIDYYNDIRALQ